MAKVNVIMATRNNAPYLKQSVDSVLKQTYTDWNLIIVDDASTDESQDILREYNADPRIKVIHNTENCGLTRSCNIALRECDGDYVMRLDGDDFLDENAIAVLAMILDQKPEIDLVDCDHFLVSEHGNVLEYVRRQKLYEEVEVLDLPPISTAVMIKRRCYEALNGYNEDLLCQDTYDFWMRFIQQFKAYNVNLPLWYYRQHSGTLTTNKERILETRRRAKKSYVEQEYPQETRPKALAVIPMRARSSLRGNLALHEIAGQPLIAYVIRTALATKSLDRVVVSTEDDQIAGAARELGAEVIMRPAKLARPKTPIEGTIMFVLSELAKEGYEPDIVAILHAISPMMKTSNIEEAIDSLLIYHTDSVISVVPDDTLHYTHDKYGLTPLFRKRKVRLEREELYEENGAIYISRREVIRPESFLGETVGHVVMTPEESVHIDSEFDLWIAERMLEEKKGKQSLR